MDYVRQHWIEVVSVAIPPLPPVRIIRAIVFGIRTFRRSTRFAKFDSLVIYALVLVIGSATAVGLLEQGHDSPIQSYNDALWWSIVIITTVGYGDFIPVSAGGRVVAVVLLLGGIVIFGAITANVAAFFIRSEDPDGQFLAELLEEVKKLRQELGSVATSHRD